MHLKDLLLGFLAAWLVVTIWCLFLKNLDNTPYGVSNTQLVLILAVSLLAGCVAYYIARRYREGYLAKPRGYSAERLSLCNKREGLLDQTGPVYKSPIVQKAFINPSYEAFVEYTKSDVQPGFPAVVMPVAPDNLFKGSETRDPYKPYGTEAVDPCAWACGLQCSTMQDCEQCYMRCCYGQGASDGVTYLSPGKVLPKNLYKVGN